MIESLEPRIAPAAFVVINLNDSGPGSLRDAISQANANAGPDVITFLKGLTGVLPVSSQLSISDTLTVKGPGPSKLSLDGGFGTRVFSVTDLNDQVDSLLTISGLTFVNGFQPTVDSSGGAIATQESLNIFDCVFMGNSANHPGGAIFATQLTDGGAAISISIQKTSFLNNQVTADVDAGAISAKVRGDITIRKCDFTGNFSGGTGGAGVLEVGRGSTLLVEQSNFTANQGVDAGALHLGGDPQIDIVVRKCRFVGNRATEGDAGGLRLAARLGSEARIISSTFSGNIAAEDGGALSILPEAGIVSIVGSTFASNRAGALQQGGAILKDPGNPAEQNGELHILRSNFSGNFAGAGGALSIGGRGVLDIQFSRFVENSSAISGGAMSLFVESPTHLDGCLIAANTSNDAGGISSDFALTIRSSKIVDNTAGRFGGGISCTDLVTLKSTIVTRNIAVQSGGGIVATDVVAIKSKTTGNISPVRPD